MAIVVIQRGKNTNFRPNNNPYAAADEFLDIIKRALHGESDITEVTLASLGETIAHCTFAPHTPNL